MHIPVCVEGFDLLKNFPESSIFDPNIPFKIPNIAVKCSRCFFLKAPIQPLLKRIKARTRIFLAKVISMPNMKYETLRQTKLQYMIP